MSFIALLPLLVAALLLVGLRQSGMRTGLITLGLVLLLVTLMPAFMLPGNAVVRSLGSGLSTSLNVLSILFPGFLLYYVVRESGGLAVAARRLVQLCPNRSVQMLLLVFGLEPFIEGVSGFGLGMVVVIPLLVELGFDGTQAALLALCGQLTGPWGALGVATTLGATLTGVHVQLLGVDTALLMLPVPPAFSMLALLLSGGKRVVIGDWPSALLAGSLLALGDWGWSQLVGVGLTGAAEQSRCTGVSRAMGALYQHAGWYKENSSEITRGDRFGNACRGRTRPPASGLQQWPAGMLSPVAAAPTAAVGSPAVARADPSALPLADAWIAGDARGAGDAAPARGLPAAAHAGQSWTVGLWGRGRGRTSPQAE